MPRSTEIKRGVEAVRWEEVLGTTVTTPTTGLSRTPTEQFLMVREGEEGANTSHPRVETVGCRKHSSEQ